MYIAVYQNMFGTYIHRVVYKRGAIGRIGKVEVWDDAWEKILYGAQG